MAMDYVSKAASLAGLRIREHDAGPVAIHSESEIQARWYSGEFGREFVDTERRKVTVRNFGRWNHEAGPDFKGCEIEVEGSGLLHGDIEIDLDVRNWERHGHATNPAFNEVVLHVFVTTPQSACFSRTESHRNVIQVQLQRDSFAAKRKSMRNVFPEEFSDWKDEKLVEFLEAAAHYRLRSKGLALARIFAAHGEGEALFQALATVLGYKNNRIPFLLLAQRAGLARARATGGEALLFGLAGFLDGGEFHLYEEGSRSYQRELWETWWRERAGFERLVLGAKAWNLSGCRPANHPHRRVAALACIAKRFDFVRKAFASGDAEECARAFHAIHHPFWEQNWSLAADSLPRRLAVIGEQRINEVLTNVYFPLRIVQHGDGWDAFCGRQEMPYRMLREELIRFFGTRPQLQSQLRRCVIQQGLLQVARDFGKISSR